MRGGVARAQSGAAISGPDPRAALLQHCKSPALTQALAASLRLRVTK